MNTNAHSPTDEDWTWLEQAVGGRPTTPTPTTAQPPPPEEPPPERLRVRTADEILAEDGVVAQPAAVPSPKDIPSRKPTSAAGVVYADEHPATPASEPTAPSTSDSAVVAELKGIRRELEAMNAYLATMINKLPAKRGA
jgi:hypothetical protein